ncbi:unnamed protein product [Leuciscus chuanchicus]
MCCSRRPTNTSGSSRRPEVFLKANASVIKSYRSLRRSCEARSSSNMRSGEQTSETRAHTNTGVGCQTENTRIKAVNVREEPNRELFV